jgi:hypothetical protein
MREIARNHDAVGFALAADEAPAGRFMRNAMKSAPQQNFGIGREGDSRRLMCQSAGDPCPGALNEIQGFIAAGARRHRDGDRLAAPVKPDDQPAGSAMALELHFDVAAVNGDQARVEIFPPPSHSKSLEQRHDAAFTRWL